MFEKKTAFEQVQLRQTGGNKNFAVAANTQGQRHETAHRTHGKTF